MSEHIYASKKKTRVCAKREKAKVSVAGRPLQR